MAYELLAGPVKLKMTCPADLENNFHNFNIAYIYIYTFINTDDLPLQLFFFINIVSIYSGKIEQFL